MTSPVTCLPSKISFSACLSICLISIASIQYIPKNLIMLDMLRSLKKSVGLMRYFIALIG